MPAAATWRETEERSGRKEGDARWPGVDLAFELSRSAAASARRGGSGRPRPRSRTARPPWPRDQRLGVRIPSGGGEASAGRRARHRASATMWRIPPQYSRAPRASSRLASTQVMCAAAESGFAHNPRDRRVRALRGRAARSRRSPRRSAGERASVAIDSTTSLPSSPLGWKTSNDHRDVAGQPANRV